MEMVRERTEDMARLAPKFNGGINAVGERGTKNHFSTLNEF
jgi:hypothetical protein